MNIVKKKVVHLVYGIGEIVNFEENKITVQFSNFYGEKKFQYPEAFSHYLKMVEDEAQTVAVSELVAKQRLAELEIKRLVEEIALERTERNSKKWRTKSKKK